jgi:hypothetical protein
MAKYSPPKVWFYLQRQRRRRVGTGGSTGPSGPALLLESGLYFLLEDGSFLLLE